MPQSKTFTADEDAAILYLYDGIKIKQWSAVAKKMLEDFKFQRNAKQCRDRYRQVINPYSTPGWSYSEEKELCRLHNSVGNKWALIASHFPGKTDNFVKNHFYSKIRKALRQINRLIKSYFKKEIKQIKIATIYKIIEGFQEQFKQKPIVSQQISDQCCVLKDALITMADQIDDLQQRFETVDIQRQRMFIERILQFNRRYRKKSKKQKRQSLQLDELFKPAKKIELLMPFEGTQQQDSQFEGVNSVASSDSEENFDAKNLKHKEDQMKQEKDELRKSPIYVIIKDDQSPNSCKSGIDIRLSDVSGKMEDESRQRQLLGYSGNTSCKNDYSFGFLRGESSFRSYRSQSVTSQKSKTDMFGQVRISGELNNFQMDAQREQNIFRSQRQQLIHRSHK